MRRRGTVTLLAIHTKSARCCRIVDAARAAGVLWVVVAVALGGTASAQPQAASAGLGLTALPPEPLSWHGDPNAPDISGVWVRADTSDQASAPGSGSKSKERWTPWPPPLKPPLLATWQERVAAAAAGKRTDDPVRACLPPGMPRFVSGTTSPMQIIQTPGRVVEYRDGDPPRRIWIDGQPLPSGRNLESFYAGTSEGRYEGKDLLVETVGIRDQPIDGTGVPHSDDLKITERYHRVDAKTLQVEITLIDPAAYTQNMTTTVTYKALDNPLWEPREFICTPVTDYHPDIYVR